MLRFYDMLARAGIVIFILLAANACSDVGERSPEGGVVSWLGGSDRSLTSGHPDGSARSQTAIGDGRTRPAPFVDLAATHTLVPPNVNSAPVSAGPDGNITLNFADTDIQDFVRTVYSEAIHENIVIDARLAGKVNIRSATPLNKSQAIEMVRQVVEMNGGVLTTTAGVNKVVLKGDRSNQNALAGELRVIPLRYISGAEAQSALQAFSTTSAEVSANTVGRFLLIRGQASDLEMLTSVVETLDSDALSGKSFALLPLKDANAPEVANELMRLFGGGGSSGYQVLAIQRMNAVLVISRAKELISRSREWVVHLDHSGNDSRRVYVVPVQNRRAVDIANVLKGTVLKQQGADVSEVAPNLTPTTTQLGSTTTANSTTATSTSTDPSSPAKSNSESSTANQEQPGKGTSKEFLSADIRADPGTNSIIIVSSPADYEVIQSAIRRLDILPSQVLIEATIFEVTLNDNLQYGVNWYLQNGGNSFGLTNNDSGTVSTTNPGFNYALSLPNAHAVISALQQTTDVEVISSPVLTVQDNQTATLKVGDQVPIATSSATSVTTVGAPIVNSIEFRDTGIILTVTPRVNASGLVLLDINQEASDVVPTTTSSLNSPTIRQRKVASSISVESGSEIILGGLISHTANKERDGVPFFKDIPVVGNAFTSSRTKNLGRTELVIIIKPTILANPRETMAVTQEIKSKLRSNITTGSQQ